MGFHELVFHDVGFKDVEFHAVGFHDAGMTTYIYIYKTRLEYIGQFMIGDFIMWIHTFRKAKNTCIWNFMNRNFMMWEIKN